MKNVKLLLLLFIFSSCAVAQTTSHDTAALRNLKGPRIKFIYGGNNYDFGRVALNSSATYEFQFQNSGDEPLIITDMHTAQDQTFKPAGDINITWPKKPVKPGKYGLVVITYTAKDEIGSFKNDIYITSNATTANYSFFHITGAITPVSERAVEKSNEPQQHASSKEGAIFEVLANSLIWVVEEGSK